MATGVVRGDDGVRRCRWGDAPPECRRYHDEEWGRPVGSDEGVFEKLCLEGFQSGLSWLTILRKREAFRRAFSSFDPAGVASFGEAEIDRLMSDEGIVRNRAKILATVANARALLRMREAGLSLAALLWSHEPPRARAPRAPEELPASTPESAALSAELRREGFRFVGPTTVYATMQSLGVVNDHLAGCDVRALAESERSQFVRPRR